MAGGKKQDKGKKSTLSKSKQKALQREQDRKQSVFNGFSAHYEQEWGTERWQGLLEALQKPVRHCLLINKYCHTDDLGAKLTPLASNLERLEYLQTRCLVSRDQSRYPPPSHDRHKLRDYYILDAGSVLATEALALEPHDRVLDLCAAPGGKSLAILQKLDPRMGGQLTVNELSNDRRRRLRQVLDEYLPPDVVEEAITVTGRDGTKRYSEPEQYDKVLLDAPCSSERHLLHDEKEFEMWTPKRTVINAKRQLALLKAAAYSVAVGGLVVYGTCSISSVENDKVISKMLRKGKVPLEVVRRTWPIGEPTKYGWIVLPDKTEGWGPLFFAVLRRTGVEKEDKAASEDEEEGDPVQDEDEEGEEAV